MRRGPDKGDDVAFEKVVGVCFKGFDKSAKRLSARSDKICIRRTDVEGAVGVDEGHRAPQLGSRQPMQLFRMVNQRRRQPQAAQMK